jgi:hypothetical protein
LLSPLVWSLYLSAVFFIGLAVQKNDYLTSQLRAQNITLGLTQDQIAKGRVVDNMATAETAAATLAKHLQSIAPSYSDLMSANPSGKYDPTNPTDLTYAQGLNLENAMNMAVLGYGLVQETMATGGALAVIGIAVTALGGVLARWSRKPEEAVEKALMAEAVLAGS